MICSSLKGLKSKSHTSPLAMTTTEKKQLMAREHGELGRHSSRIVMLLNANGTTTASGGEREVFRVALDVVLISRRGGDSESLIYLLRYPSRQFSPQYASDQDSRHVYISKLADNPSPRLDLFCIVLFQSVNEHQNTWDAWGGNKLLYSVVSHTLLLAPNKQDSI